MPPQYATPRDRGHSTNLVGVSTDLLASAAFNAHPLPLHITGAREMYRSLLEMLDQSETPTEAADVFSHYMGVVFGLDPDQREKADQNKTGPVRRYRSSYLRLLKGWGYDSNSPEGAVLKGWVESRFGLFPTFHKQVLTRFSGDAWMTYVAEKMSSRFHNNAIQTQLDLLYEFSQWALARYHAPGQTHVRLYRAVNDFDEHPVVETIDRRRRVLRLNNLVSFSCERDMADVFGDMILEADVPVVKIMFFNGLIPSAPLRGEAEYLVIGGDFLVKASYL